MQGRTMESTLHDVFFAYYKQPISLNAQYWPVSWNPLFYILPLELLTPLLRQIFGSTVWLKKFGAAFFFVVYFTLCYQMSVFASLHDYKLFNNRIDKDAQALDLFYWLHVTILSEGLFTCTMFSQCNITWNILWLSALRYNNSGQIVILAIIECSSRCIRMLGAYTPPHFGRGLLSILLTLIDSLYYYILLTCWTYDLEFPAQMMAVNVIFCTPICVLLSTVPNHVRGNVIALYSCCYFWSRTLLGKNPTEMVLNLVGRLTKGPEDQRLTTRWSVEDNSSDQSVALSQRCQCVICLEADREVMMMPCLHVCLCSKCASLMGEYSMRIPSARTYKKCPVCQAGVESVKRVYF